MPWFLTDYRSNWAPHEEDGAIGHYGANLWARSAKYAAQVARDRGMGEIVISSGSSGKPYRYASEWLRIKPKTRAKQHALFRDTLHALCYLSQIALASKVAQPWEIVGDEGIIHDFVHQRERNMKRLLAQVIAIEHRVPGYLQPEGSKRK